MEDSLDDFLEGSILSDMAVLERVDEYTLYTYYLGFKPELGLKFSSPVRANSNQDTVGSFSIYPPASKKARNEYLWKDNGTGQTGNIFKLVGLLHNTSKHEDILRIIDRDFKLGFSHGEPVQYQMNKVTAPIFRGMSEIRIKSRDFRRTDLEYWMQFGITRATLIAYNVTAVEMYWLFADQKYPKTTPDPCYAYRIWSKYKLYRPKALDKGDKFRNNFTEKHIEGFTQLKYDQDLLIITKSLKDVMMLREFGYEAVASHSESNILPQDALNYFQAKYKRIVVWYDNDGKTQADKYPYQKIYVPVESGEKDPTDYYKRYGAEATQLLITQLLCQSN
jgi:hypothetical protein